ncbi:MAG: hypothetical protein ACOCYQ_05360, partial [Alkalispirochaeta sp.]
PWLFVIGDIIRGPDVINGVATGHTAALGIDYYLTHREKDEIRRIDDVLRIARRFEQREAEQLEVLAADLGDDGGVDSGETGLLVERALEIARDALDDLDEILGNRNVRLHLRQELNREQLQRDFARIAAVPAYPETIDGSLPERIREHRRIAAGLYTDILHLTRNKELEFTVERLRDLNTVFSERIVSGTLGKPVVAG